MRSRIGPSSNLLALWLSPPTGPIGYLRAFIPVLVLAHHVVLAYHHFAPPVLASLVTQPRWWQAFPVVDSQRWSGFALFVGFNDVFSCR
jgi:hypothetical protein